MSETNFFGYDALKKSVSENEGVLSAGKSWLMRDIFAMSSGDGGKKLLVFGDLSADSSESAKMITRLWKDITASVMNNTNLQSFKVPFLLRKIKIYFLPLPNPDGCELFNSGLSEYNPFYDRIIRFSPDKDFSTLKANARGTELDLNFSENFTMARNLSLKNGIRGPSLFGYCGEYPESERESSAVSYFMRKLSFDSVVVLRKGERHISGKQNMLKGAVGLISGYGNIPYANEEAKDGSFILWVENFLNIPAVTVSLPFEEPEKDYRIFTSSVMLSAASLLG